MVAGLTKEDATAFEAILERLKSASDAKNDAELADKLGLKRSSVSTAKTRQMIPSSWIINAANLFSVSSDWLIFGDEKFLGKAPQKTQPAQPLTAQPEIENNHKYNKMADSWALDLAPAEFKNLWDQYWDEKEVRRGWLQVEVIKRFPEFLEWLEQRPAPLKPAQIAALKRGAQALHRGLAEQLDDD